MGKRDMVSQLALPIELRDDATFDNFCWHGQEILRSQLEAALMEESQERFFYLWGAQDVGKTHILQSCCHHLGRLGKPAMYLSLDTALNELSPDALEGMENLSLIAIDDIEVIDCNPRWQEAIFHLFNRIREQERTVLIITGNAAPSHLSLSLADLRSRLSWGLVFHLQALDEAHKQQILIERAEQLGLKLSPPVVQFLINRCSRSMSNLLHMLGQLDQASLAAKRRLTIPFVKEVLGL